MFVLAAKPPSKLHHTAQHHLLSWARLSQGSLRKPPPTRYNIYFSPYLSPLNLPILQYENTLLDHDIKKRWSDPYSSLT